MRYLENKDVKVLYMGTPEISAPILERLVSEGFDVVAVVTQPDREIGRKRILTPCPVKEVALKHNLAIYQPIKIRKDYEFAKNIEFDVIVTMAYGQIVPTELLNLAKVGAINLHGSLLPLYRGAAPIQRSIIEGKKEAGVTLMEMVAKMDAGDMYDKTIVPIEENDNYTSLAKKISSAAEELIAKDLLKYANKELKGLPQKEEEVTFAEKILPEHEHLDISLPAKDFLNWVKGLSEEPGGYLYLNERKLKIYQAEYVDDSVSFPVGSYIPMKKKFLLQLKDGTINLLLVQPEGKGKMEGFSYLNGAHLVEGVRLS
ncbi:MAG: methionyl-tRNA formyltransferase [Bacilli bacterium]|nr:methionyl-tRNA formyltransferase [Bacilli bacterium]